MGHHIRKAIDRALFLTVASFVSVIWFRDLFQTIKSSKTFFYWTVSVSITPITVAGIVTLVALYIHFPVQYLYTCCKRNTPRRTRVLSHVTEKPTVRSSEWDHRNVPSFTVTHILHETVTGSETSRLIAE